MNELASSLSPIVVAGMHRSGTSLVAGYLQSLGVDMGARLLAADHANPRGYFEDRLRFTAGFSKP